MLEPDKVSLAILYYLHATEDPEDEPEGIGKALGGIATTAGIRAQLERLAKLGLVIDCGPMPLAIGGVVMPGNEVWGITHDGAAYAHALIRQPKSFMSRLHAKGLSWLNSPDAAKAKLATKLAPVEVDQVTRGFSDGETASSPSINWAKWGAIATILSVLVAIILALVL